MANVTGTNGADTLTSTGDSGGDTFRGRGGDDTITGGNRSDRANQNVSRDGADTVNLRGGLDLVTISADDPTNVRLSVTSSEVGDGSAFDGGGLAPQDSGLAVRLQAETAGTPAGPLSRYDDEGMIFSAGQNVTFDVRDLITGAQRGEGFEVVILGTHGDDTQTTGDFSDRVYYFNGGQGSDTIFGGNRGDFLVGGADSDRLTGGLGDDRFIGGAGGDIIAGGVGNDTIAVFNVTTDGPDRVNLGVGDDLVRVSASAPTNVRLTFTSAEVGNNFSSDSGTLANQDGLLAVRLQAETAGTPAGSLSRFDDEGITFAGDVGVTFDVRDLVSGAQRGEAFEIVQLGSNRADTLAASSSGRSYYVNGGQGNDVLATGAADDFLVGGMGDDRLSGDGGNDRFIGGAGNDVFSGGDGDDVVVAFNLSSDGADQGNLGMGSDTVNLTKDGGGQIRISFTSAEVGNSSSLDSNTLPNQDGGFAVRVQAEDGLTDVLTGPVSRFDDEGITFVAPSGVRLDVRDLPTGTPRGAGFGVATLGTAAADTLTAINPRANYINGGGGDDVLTGGLGSDSLVGNVGDDVLDGGAAHDTLLGGGGADTIAGGDGNDLIIGGAGGDSLSGQAGADTFRYEFDSDSSLGAQDTIGGFDSGVDKIDLSRVTEATYTLTIQNFSGFDLVTLDNGSDGSIELSLRVEGEPVLLGDFIL